MKAAELTGLALDWAVAKCEGVAVDYVDDGINRCLLMSMGGRFNPSTNWAQGGLIIEREKISIEYYKKTNEWLAVIAKGFFVFRQWGNSPLVSAMRCYVASKLGDQIDIPTELMEGK